MNITNELKMAKIAINKSFLKEFFKDNERIVYLKDDDEFQISLFNPKDYTIGAEIYVNGSAIGGTIVLKPGERVWLERYLSDSSKFKFSTYEVEANNEIVKNAIKNNGKVEIKFFKERNFKYFNEIKPIYINYDQFYNNNTLYRGATTLTNSNYETYASTSLMYDNDVNNFSNSIKTNIASNVIETGRVEKGSFSNQKFKDIYINFESLPFETEIIKLLPISQKQYNSNDLKKVYCTNCGRKINQKFKYCPYCGEKIL